MAEGKSHSVSTVPLALRIYVRIALIMPWRPIIFNKKRTRVYIPYWMFAYKETLSIGQYFTLSMTEINQCMRQVICTFIVICAVLAVGVIKF